MNDSVIMKNWVDRFQSAYGEKPLADVPWFRASPGIKIMQAAIDGLIRPGLDVVDVGCGPGCDSVFMACCGANVTGIDSSSVALVKARALADWAGVNVRLIHASIVENGLPPSSVDLVNDSFVFHNIDHSARKSYRDEIHRILKPGGIFLLNSFSDRMEPGTGPMRITSDEIFATFSADMFSCQRLENYRNIPTPSRPGQHHWFAVFKKLDQQPPAENAAGRPR